VSWGAAEGGREACCDLHPERCEAIIARRQGWKSHGVSACCGPETCLEDGFADMNDTALDDRFGSNTLSLPYAPVYRFVVLCLTSVVATAVCRR
jgi:hypothetical protein